MRWAWSARQARGNRADFFPIPPIMRVSPMDIPGIPIAVKTEVVNYSLLTEIDFLNSFCHFNLIFDFLKKISFIRLILAFPFPNSKIMKLNSTAVILVTVDSP